MLRFFCRTAMRVLFILSLTIHLAFGFTPKDNYLIDCGSDTNITIGNRTFLADTLGSNILSASNGTTILANTTSSSSSISSPYNSSLFLTARIFNTASRYSFLIQETGRHIVRLYFFPFVFGSYNMSRAEFSVSAQNVTLLKNFRAQNGAVVKDYSLNVTTGRIVLSFIPSHGSFAFINALEITSMPPEVIPDGANSIETAKQGYRNLQDRALETVARVNMGNTTVSPERDSLWRYWVSDGSFLKYTKVSIESKPEAVSYKADGPTENVAPVDVYGTATMADTAMDPQNLANLTWLFDVDPGFEYLVRFHFCDMVNSTRGSFLFNVFVNSRFAYQRLNLGALTTVGAPYYFDVVVSPTQLGELTMSLGPTTDAGQYPMVILNGLEIMKLSNSKESLDPSDAKISSSSGKSNKIMFVVIGSVSGSVLVAMVIVVSAIFLARKKRRKLATLENFTKEEEHSGLTRTDGMSVFSRSKIGYKFPFWVIEEATDKFSESRVIGVGGFGKVYKGVLRDGTQVAVKRGSGKSNQGLLEFRTEVEMLSQFRHRHLVSLIGYCDERDEMIIIYEFMENGTVKDHLYGPADRPGLSWRQRLEICIGSARGLHYLHTGPAKAIIHRDVKTANILLDENFMAKVADFGLSKAGPGLHETHVSTAIKGSFGYLDPEYLTRQQLTEKSDVYSFGVVMLEILSGRPVIDPTRPREEVNLVDWAVKWRTRGKLGMIVDPRIQGKMKEESLVRFVEIAEKCLAECGIDRLSMGDVLWNLEFALRLEGAEEERPARREGFLSGVSRSEMSVSEFSMGSVRDLAGVSMSKVFANMVKEEMR